MKGQIKSATTPTAYFAALKEPDKSQLKEIDAFIRKAVPKLKRVVMKGILGYGPIHYRYASGREGDWFKIGIAANKQSLAIYLCAVNEKGYLAEQNAKLLGKCSCGKSCIRFKKFADLDHAVLKRLVQEAATLEYGHLTEPADRV